MSGTFPGNKGRVNGALTSRHMRIAALDLGSNSFHLLVVDAHPDGTFVPLIREKDMLRLGDAVGREGRIPDALADRAVAAVDRFRKLAAGAGTEEIHARATAALREAENGGEVRVISGQEEARLIFEAVKAAVVIDPGPALCLDLGGGSLEIMVGDRSGLSLAASVPRSINQFTFTREELLPLHEEFLTRRASERASIPGLEAKRADIIATGSTLLLTAMELFGFDRMTVSEWALREGIVLDVIPRHEEADWSGDPGAIRMSSVLQLARRCNWDEGHGRHTARLALDLFDQTIGLHGLAPEDRELLEHASLLHDIGEHVSTESHHKHSAYLIQHGRLRGFTPEEVDFVAALARAHRGGGPKPSHEPFASLDRAARDRVTRLAALLRVADGLDRGRSANVDGIELVLNGSRAQLLVKAHTDIAIELWG